MNPIEITITIPDVVTAAYVMGGSIVAAALIYLVKK